MKFQLILLLCVKENILDRLYDYLNEIKQILTENTFNAFKE
jgi:hypothetical protein